MTEPKERCQHTLDIVDGETDASRRESESYKESIRRAVDAAIENLSGAGNSRKRNPSRR